MNKDLVRGLEDLQVLAERGRETLYPSRPKVVVGMSSCGLAAGAGELFESLENIIAKRQAGIALARTGCIGFCQREPLVDVIIPGKPRVIFSKLEIDALDNLVEKAGKGEIPAGPAMAYIEQPAGEMLGLGPKGNGNGLGDVPHLAELDFYSKQRRIALRNCGLLDPGSIEEYVARGGYRALCRMLKEMSPESVIDQVTRSGLRGRGGAGFPTGRKWALCRNQAAEQKYIICNGDEGDPGAFMDRSVMEGDPHSVIEGMAIGAYAIGANKGYLYVRGEYPLAIDNLAIAIDQARAVGLLGKNIMGTDFSFDLGIVRGAGAFVCGEETALIISMQGDIGTPRQRPPFPAQAGLWGKPTNINNVESWANVPAIIDRGADWFAEIGTEGSKGTKVFSLVGKVENTGLVEVPMGTPLRDIVFDIGGGIQNNRAFKAVQTGGPSGGCIPASLLDLPVDFDKLRESGAMMGSGGLIVMDERTCMVDLAKYFLTFLMDESCGKCTPCREGLFQMHSILTRICNGEGVEEDIGLLEGLAEYVKDSSLCQLGGTAPNSVLSTLKYFRHEFEEHIRQKHCRASVCEGLVDAPCSHACPAGINVAQYVGLIAEGRPGEAVDMIRRRNPFVSVCGRVCDAPCEKRCRRSDVDEPLAIRALKRYAFDNADKGSGTPVSPAAGKSEVAIIGSGPAGLSCAYFLALMGRPSTVFEALPIAGGLLAVGIPEYRLPKASLQADIDFILSHGVELRTNARVDSIARLRADGYKAVFVGTGAPIDSRLGIEGEGLDGVEESLAFLRNRALDRPVKCGKRVAVIGGGNAALDTARSARRLGAGKVTILYRRTRAEMPAYKEEIEAALDEGIELVELVTPVRVRGEGGKVSGIEMIRMKLGETDRSGRRRPVPVEGSEFVIECDTIIPAIGQAPSTELTGGAVDVASWGGVKADALTGATSAPDVFAGGDCVSGGATVVEAIAEGQKAAVAIDRMLGGAGALPDNTGTSTKKPSEEDLEKTLGLPRVTEPELPVDERIGSFAEVLCDLMPGAACGEAARCLRCDLERAEARKSEARKNEMSGAGVK
jgi:NADH-quinone oxidoreductase subunit F